MTRSKPDIYDESPLKPKPPSDEYLKEREFHNWVDNNIDRIREEVESDGPTTLTLRGWRLYESLLADTADEPRYIPDDFGR